jgi:alpha-beta hydrolase superfamily lysophospholipase
MDGIPLKAADAGTNRDVPPWPTAAAARRLAAVAFLSTVAFAAIPTALADDAADGEPRATNATERDLAWLERLRRSREALEWTDEAVRHDWRLQHRPGTADWRLLDPADHVRRAGTVADCSRALDELAQDGSLPPVTGDAVVLLHGLGEGRGSMRPLAGHLRATLGATVMTFGYASVKAGIDEHAAALARVVAGMPQARRISFVGHSLGGLVIRRWHAIAAADDLARVHRVVMLGSPNQGSDLARMAARVWGVAATADGAARDLLVDWHKVAPSLAVPDCDLGIIAGGKQDANGYSVFLEGDDDAVVRVEETRLEGAEDFLIVPVHHAAMMKHPDVQRATAAFLETGRFPAAAAAAADSAP